MAPVLPPYFRTHSTPIFSSTGTTTTSTSSSSYGGSNPPSPSARAIPTLHSALLHALPLPHLLFDSSLRLHSLNDAARSVFGITSGHGGPSAGGGDFPPGGADVFFCVTKEMAGKGAQEKIRKELERLAEREEDRATGAVEGGMGGMEWAWGEGDRIELKSGRVPGLRWSAEAKVSRFTAPVTLAEGYGFPGSRRSSRPESEAGKGEDDSEAEEDLPSWLGRRDTVLPSPTSNRSYFSVLLLRPWREPVPPPMHQAHEKLLQHRRSFSLDTSFGSNAQSLASPSLFSSSYAPNPSSTPPPVLNAASPFAAAGPPGAPNFASFTFPPHNASPPPGNASLAPTTLLSPINTSAPPTPLGNSNTTPGFLRRKESYSERTPTLGSVSGGNPFSWSSLAVRRESLNAIREQEAPTVTSSPNFTGGAGAGWEFSRPFGRVVEDREREKEESDADEEAENEAQAPPSNLLVRRRSSLEGAPADPREWNLAKRGNSPPLAGASTLPPPIPEADSSVGPLPSTSKPFRLPHSSFAAANALSPRTASGLGPNGNGSAGSAGSGSSSGGNSARSSMYSATTDATSPSRRGSVVGGGGGGGGGAQLAHLPDALKGIGISVSSAGIQITQSSVPPPTVPLIARRSSRVNLIGGGPFTPSAAEEVATPMSSSSVLTPTPVSSHSLPAPTPMNFTPNRFNLHPPPRPHPLSLSRSAQSSTSSSAGSSPSQTSNPPNGAFSSPRPTALPPLPPHVPAPKPDLASLLKFSAIANLPKTGVILSDSDLSSGYVNALARELLMGVPATDGVSSTGTGGSSLSHASHEEWWTQGMWSSEDEPWTSMASATSQMSGQSASSQPFFSPSSENRANPFEAKDLQFQAIIAAGEASTVEKGRGTAGSGLRIGRAAESNRYRNTVAGILARSLVSDERRKAALGRTGAGGGLGGVTGGPPTPAHQHAGFSSFGAFKSPGGQSSSGASSSGHSGSTTAGQTPAFVANGGKPYKVFDNFFSQRTVDPLEAFLEMTCRKGEEPPVAPDESDDEEDNASTAGTVYNGMIIGVETEVWETSSSSSSNTASSPSDSSLPSSLKNDSFVSASSSSSGHFAGRKKRVRRRIIEVTAAPIFAPGPNGTKQHLGGVLLLRDVTTERKRSSSLSEGHGGGGGGGGGGGRSKKKGKTNGEVYFKRILDAMPQMVWTTTPLGSHTMFNSRWYEYTGLEPEQSLGLGWQSPFHPQDMPTALSAWAHSLETGEPYAVEYRCRRYDGAWRWMLGRALPYRDADGTIQGWSGTCTDFDELYHMREQLRSTLQQNAAVLAGAGCLLIAVDTQKTIVFYAGAKKEELLSEAGIEAPIEGKPFALLQPSEAFMDSVDAVLAGDAPQGRVEGLARLGRTYRCLLTPLTQTRPDGSTYNVGCIIVAHDITDLVQTQTQLRESYEERAKLQASEEGALEASRLKSEFLALTSHELRTPIAHILGLSELLLATEPLTETQRNLAQQSLRSADVLLELVGTVLDMGKIEAGKLDIEIRAFDLNELSSDARFFSTAAKKKGLEFIEDVDSFPVEVMGDMPRLRQVVANLLANAIKFTKEGAITLRVKKVEEDENSIKVQWQVQDTGVGIRKEAAAMLFQPFRQADISTSREFGGTGLGLSISKSLIELMGGTISLTSEYGVGTVLSASLTLQKAPQDLASISMPSTPSLVGEEIIREQTHILIVDDNPLNRSIIGRLLMKMGFSVDTAEGGYEALEMVAHPEKKLYSLILMDQQMSPIDGLETTIRIRQNPNPLINSIKVVALTASALKGDQDKFIACGADGYLSKPVRSAVLEATIIRTLQPLPSVPRRKSSAASATSAASVEANAAYHAASSQESAENGQLRRRPSHPSYGEGTV